MADQKLKYIHSRSDLSFLSTLTLSSVTKKVKGKVHNLTCREGIKEEQVCICALSLTSTLDGTGG